mmetsp:Transcript_17758/g.39367  ORF Transcript_17758/g.39367 Transcript_17758/m.39367 type:complete len:349 (+) Transcript_17758:1345-2391(+)
MLHVTLVLLPLRLLPTPAVAAEGEGLRLAPVRAAGVEEQRLVCIVLLQQRRVLEALDHGLLALDAREGDCAHLFAVEALPALPIELVHEGRDALGVQEVYEAVAHVASVLEVDGQVEEVVAALVLRVHLLQQHSLCVLVRDVAHHDGGPALQLLADAAKVQRKIRLDLVVPRHAPVPASGILSLLLRVLARPPPLLCLLRLLLLLLLLHGLLRGVRRMAPVMVLRCGVPPPPTAPAPTRALPASVPTACARVRHCARRHHLHLLHLHEQLHLLLHLHLLHHLLISRPFIAHGSLLRIGRAVGPVGCLVVFAVAAAVLAVPRRCSRARPTQGLDLGPPGRRRSYTVHSD